MNFEWNTSGTMAIHQLMSQPVTGIGAIRKAGYESGYVDMAIDEPMENRLKTK